MFYNLRSYLQYISRSSNEHGIHSPFVYDLVTNCFYDRQNYEAYTLMERYRQMAIDDDELIQVTDLGAGSRVFKTNQRKTSAIAKHAGISRKRQQLLYRLVRFLKPTSILELGTSLGLSTIALALGNDKAMVRTLEGCPATSKKALAYFERFQLTNIALSTVDFNAYVAEDNTTYDLIFIDGDHHGERTLQYFDHFQKKAKNGSVIIFDDIYWKPEMTVAWKEIISSKKVKVSIDTFQWGLVFFREAQEKQHFTIRV